MRGATTCGLAATMLLAACDDSQPDNRGTRPIVVRSAEQNRLHQLDDASRHIALKRAILDSGLRCQRVTDSGYVTEYRNLSMWTARCDDGTNWGVFVGPDGSAQVRRCEDVVEVGLPACVVKGQSEKAA